MTDSDTPTDGKCLSCGHSKQFPADDGYCMFPDLSRTVICGCPRFISKSPSPTKQKARELELAAGMANGAAPHVGIDYHEKGYVKAESFLFME